ncbi:ABC transporter substrate-binding protein [Colwellia sp. Bg11-12]|uniref:substrate-binding periplasmic protein n=1 Tax=Colwellia sp. Bg11-12 TaxID=2759817 RepID=UPI0015F58874|nr:transporter substrate-binding domain-containing protein [Colwellia sp. Bg11-12]MBA6264222.1 transporter substrate-binding domain-containing protein [Colwellia sp. Bg11-12]
MKIAYPLYLTLLFLTFGASAQSDTISLNYKPKLTLYTENWAPYQYTDPQGNVKGSSIAKVKKVLDAANWPYEIQVVPWARAIFQIHVVPNSLIFSIARIPERENKYHWLGLLNTVKSKLITSSENKDIKINKLSDIKKYVLILKRKEASSLYFSEHNLINEEKVIWVTSSTQALHLLNMGRGDLYPDTEVGFTSAVENSPYNLSQFNYAYDFTELSTSLYIATSRSTDLQLVKDLSLLFNEK